MVVRCIYVLHGSSLVKEGTKLLHLLSSVFVIIYIVNRNIHAVRALAVADKENILCYSVIY